MKTLNEINTLLSTFESQYKFSVSQQGSAEWLKMKLGVLSASNAHKIVAKKDSETRLTYMSELVAQICTGEQEEINSKYLEHGKLYEAAARSSYEMFEGVEIIQVPFVFKDSSFREGCSPDGILDSKKGIEIKCPYNAVHYVKFFCEDKIKSEYQWQYQYCLRILGAKEWDFCQYQPFMKKNPLKILTVFTDDEKQKTLDDAVPQFIEDMDKMLDKIGIKFGEQWS